MRSPSFFRAQVPFLSKVQHVACSATHGLASTADGSVFWWPHAACLGAPAPAQSYEVRCAAGCPRVGSRAPWGRACSLTLLATDVWCAGQVVTLKGLSVLSLAVGNGFAVVATGPALPAPAPQVEQQQQQQEEPQQQDGAAAST